MEIERKFLVRSLPTNLIECNNVSIIVQGYLSFEPEVRIRKNNNRYAPLASQFTYLFTVKGEGDLTRPDYDCDICENTFDDLYTNVKGLCLHKDRYRVPVNGLIAELDIYNHRMFNFRTVEIEFKSEELALAFVVPDWFGTEITYDKSYKNKNLFKLINLDKYPDAIPLTIYD